MKRREFIKQCNQCAAASLLGLAVGKNELLAEEKEIKDNPLAQEMNQKQVISLLKFIESDFPGEDVQKLYDKLAYECFSTRNLEGWVKSFYGNIDEFFDRVNRGGSKYWKVLEYDKDTSRITLKSREFVSCICAFAQCENPPKSLCKICCKKFQEIIFSTLLQKRVDVRIDESILLGGERCCTTIFVD